MEKKKNRLLTGVLGLAMTAGALLVAAPEAEAGIKIRATVCPDKDVCITVGDNDKYYKRYRKKTYYRNHDYDNDYYYHNGYRRRRYQQAGYHYWQNGHQYYRDHYGNVRLIKW